MIISYKLLQTYFDKKLPKPEVVADALTFHAFEIEGMEKKGTDTIIDVKVLPNRAHDCLSHHGIAREVSAILEIPMKKLPRINFPKANTRAPKLSLEIKSKHCLRYMGLVVDGIRVGPSPKWLAEALESLGQRSINNVVDATNYVMLMAGQPLHVFDFHKVSGGKIMIRHARVEERMTTLDGSELVLTPDVLVIADKTDVLALAGIKGGTKAEVTTRTTTLLLEAANFDASAVRLTALRLGIKTDASKRFESGLTPTLAEGGMQMLAQVINEIANGGEIIFGKPLDKFMKPTKMVIVPVTLFDINRILGTTLSDRDVSSVWKRLGFSVVKTKNTQGVLYRVTIPDARLDLRIKEDMVEEVGRLLGYHKLTATMPEEPLILPVQNKEWWCRDVVRTVMLASGFSEVYTYTFLGQGEVAVANPIAADKKYLRNNLMTGLKLAVSENLKHEEGVRIFEFGHIFGRNEGKLNEEISFGALMGFRKRKEAEKKEDFFALKGALDRVCEALGISNMQYKAASGELVASVYAGAELLGMMSLHGFELNFEKIVALSGLNVERWSYKVPSRYPSLMRDVSLFVPLQTMAGEVEGIIRANADAFVQSIALIDVFEQPEQQRKSLAFRMVLQSDERTLEDKEANAFYDRVVDALRLANASWQVRV